MLSHLFDFLWFVFTGSNVAKHHVIVIIGYNYNNRNTQFKKKIFSISFKLMLSSSPFMSVPNMTGMNLQSMAYNKELIVLKKRSFWDWHLICSSHRKDVVTTYLCLDGIIIYTFPAFWAPIFTVWRQDYVPISSFGTNFTQYLVRTFLSLASSGNNK